MGRMTPTPYAGHGGTAAEVAKAWRDHERRRYMDCGRSQQQLRDEAEAKLHREPFLATDGRPCIYAIEILLSLWSRYGRDGVTPRMVRDAWLGYLGRCPSLDAYVTESLPHLARREVGA
jgi:hypothetical protein